MPFHPGPKRAPAVAAPPAAPHPPADEIEYPTSDGEPMAETDKHRQVMSRSIDALELYFSPRADRVYVSGNNFVYYEQGNPTARVSPDVYVVEGVPQRQRDSYKVWEEGGRLPVFVLEATSRKTHREDQDTKLPLYERLRVAEYFQFDPTGDYLEPRLQGFRLAPDGYHPLPLESDDRIFSQTLRLYLVMQGEELRLFDPSAARFLPTLLEAHELHLEAEEQRREAERRVEVEAQARREAEQELERLRAELEALRGDGAV